MDGVAFQWAKLVGVTAVYAVVLTALASPLLIWLYRRAVSHRMNQAAAAGSAQATARAADVTPQPAGSVRWRTVQPAGRGMGWPFAGPQGARRLQIVLAYAAGGTANALLLTVLFGLAYAHLMSAQIVATALPVFLLPVLATAIYLASPSTPVRIGSFVLCLLVLYVLLGYRQGLGASLFEGFVLLPTLLLLLFSLPFWRGVAPLVLPLAVAASLFGVAAVQLAQALGVVVDDVWPWRVTGFALGAVAGYGALRGLAALHAARRLSDQELFLDAWWLLYVWTQTLLLVLMKQDPRFFAALLGFPLYLAVQRGAMRGFEWAAPAQAPRHLLLLRVFGPTRRAQALFDRIEQHWRMVGGIRMVAGQDLALRTIDPADFVEFVSGRLGRRFVKDAPDLANRLQRLDDRADLDGRFRVEHFWCHADTWRMVMRALAERSDAVLMDLRGFTAQREGCSYELLHLARTAPAKRVVLLVDSAEEMESVRKLVHASDDDAAQWRVARLHGRDADIGADVFAELTAPAR